MEECRSMYTDILARLPPNVIIALPTFFMLYNDTQKSGVYTLISPPTLPVTNLLLSTVNVKRLSSPVHSSIDFEDPITFRHL